MRLIGRRSVASVLRWLLGFVNVFVTIGLVFTGLGLLVAIVFPESAAVFVAEVANESGGLADGMLAPLRMIFLATFIASFSTWWVLNRLRRMFLAVNQGDAFERPNVARLQAVGLGLIGIQVSALIMDYYAPDRVQGSYGGLDLGAWLGILIVFMLAEVFRQGAAMRDDQQMTV